MKAQDLRIGNYYQYAGNSGIIYARVKGIKQNEFGFFSDLDGVNFGICKPIPLTEEWLEKFGIDFSIEKEWHQLTFTIKGLLFETASSMEGFTYNLCFDNMINIKHVHQLQNLYFCLYGEELTIKE